MYKKFDLIESKKYYESNIGNSGIIHKTLCV